MTNYDRVITAVAKKFNMTKAEVEDIHKSQFKLVVNIMRDNLDTHADIPVRLPYFGSFVVKPGRRKSMNSNQLTKKHEEI